jgi:hypothetical protein
MKNGRIVEKVWTRVNLDGMMKMRMLKMGLKEMLYSPAGKASRSEKRCGK